MAIDTNAIRSAHKLSEAVAAAGNALIRDGSEFKCVCPFHVEKTPSFFVNDTKGVYHCHGCGAKGDVINFTMDAYNINFHAACDMLAGKFGTNPKPIQPVEEIKKNPYDGLMPYAVPESEKLEAGKRIRVWNPKTDRWVHYQPTMVHAFRTAEYEIMGYELRLMIDNKKIPMIVRYAVKPDGEVCWANWPFDKPRPIYGLDRMAAHPDAQVLIVEGPKSADAAVRLLQMCAVAWAGGANGIDKVDWLPLKGRSVAIWGDADEPGEKCAVGGLSPAGARIKGLVDYAIEAGAAVVKVIPWDKQREKGWDVADAEQEGATKAEIIEWIKGRIVVVGSEKPAADASEPDQRADEPPPAEEPMLGDFVDLEPDFEDDKPPFRHLGYNRNVYFYMPRGKQQVIELTASAHSKLNLLALASLHYWESNFGGKSGISWDKAAAAMMGASERYGIFTYSRVRGIGAWKDDERTIIHAGDRTYIENTAFAPADVPSKYIYEATSDSVDIRVSSSASNREANEFAKICDRLTWESQISGQLLAGWCVIAPICGALPWRPHIWVTGPAKAGKSTIIEAIVKKIVGPMGAFYQSSTTEAAIRRKVQYNALAVILDEAESENRQNMETLQRVIQLARVGSSGGSIAKADDKGGTIDFNVRSCFCFSSINTAVKEHADETRITMLTLRKNEASDRDLMFKELERDIYTLINKDFGARMFARTLENINNLLKNIETFTNAVATVLQDRRTADQLGGMLAGYYLCYSTGVVTYDRAVEWLKERNWQAFTAEDTNDEAKLVSRIATHRIRLTLPSGNRDTTIGEMIVSIAKNRMDDDFFNEVAHKELKRMGIKLTLAIFWLPPAAQARSAAAY